MKIEQYLPIAQMVLCFSAGIVYIVMGEWKKGIYWLAAGTISACVIF